MGSTDTAELSLKAGAPFTRVIRIVDAKNVWASLDDLEVRAQLRMGESTTTKLIANLHEFMTWDFDENDLVINFGMTGEQTRQLYSRRWGTFKTGYFNLVVSDKGPADNRALVVPVLKMTITDMTTTSGGDL